MQRFLHGFPTPVHIFTTIFVSYPYHNAEHDCFTWVEHQQVVRFSMLAVAARLYDAAEDKHFPATAAGAVPISRRQVPANIYFLPRKMDT